MSIFFYKRLLGTDAINSLLFFKDVFFSLIEKGPGNKDIYLLSSKLNVKNVTPTFLELGPAWAKEISHQTLDLTLPDPWPGAAQHGGPLPQHGVQPLVRLDPSLHLQHIRHPRGLLRRR